MREEQGNGSNKTMTNKRNKITTLDRERNDRNVSYTVRTVDYIKSTILAEDKRQRVGCLFYSYGWLEER